MGKGRLTDNRFFKRRGGVPISVTLSCSTGGLTMSVVSISKKGASDIVSFCGFKSMKRGRVSGGINACGCRGRLVPRVTCISSDEVVTISSRGVVMFSKDRGPGLGRAVGLRGLVSDMFCGGGCVKMTCSGGSGGYADRVGLCSFGNGVLVRGSATVTCGDVRFSDGGRIYIAKSATYRVCAVRKIGGFCRAFSGGLCGIVCGSNVGGCVFVCSNTVSRIELG